MCDNMDCLEVVAILEANIRRRDDDIAVLIELLNSRQSSTTTSAEKVLEQIEKIISDRIQELKYPKSHDCVREAILGENQALWAQIKELRMQAERERG